MAITSANKDGNNICHKMIQHSHKLQKQQPQWQQHLPPTKEHTYYGNNISQLEEGNNICQ